MIWEINWMIVRLWTQGWLEYLENYKPFEHVPGRMEWNALKEMNMPLY